MSPTNTDSDSSSVESDEVLESHYPVKPRRTIRMFEREEIMSEIERPETSPEVEEALKMLQLMNHANKDIFDLEAGREDLEGTSEVITLTCCSFHMFQLALLLRLTSNELFAIQPYTKKPKLHMKHTYVFCNACLSAHCTHSRANNIFFII